VPGAVGLAGSGFAGCRLSNAVGGAGLRRFIVFGFPPWPYCSVATVASTASCRARSKTAGPPHRPVPPACGFRCPPGQRPRKVMGPRLA
jgi:hypothetical protein